MIAREKKKPQEKKTHRHEGNVVFAADFPIPDQHPHPNPLFPKHMDEKSKSPFSHAPFLGKQVFCYQLTDTIHKVSPQLYKQV